MPKAPLVDARRRRYVPMDSLLAFGDFGTKLAAKWGMEGLCSWMLFLAACKRETVEGIFTYTSEAEGWGKLGAAASGFTLDEFFTFTGRLRKTSRRRHGRIVYVTCTGWNTWNEDWKRERDAAQKSSKRREKTSDGTGTKGGRSSADTSPDVDVDVDTPLTPLSDKERKRLERWAKEFAVQSNLSNDEITDYLTRQGADEMLVARLLRVAEEARAA